MDYMNGDPLENCEQCGEQFLGKTCLEDHKITKHRKNYSEKQGNCELCGEQFDGELYLKRHRTYDSWCDDSISKDSRPTDEKYDEENISDQGYLKKL